MAFFAWQHGPIKLIEPCSIARVAELPRWLETAPYLIAIFVESYSFLPDGHRAKNYHITESVSIVESLTLLPNHPK